MGMYTQIAFAAEVDAEAYAILSAIKETGEMPDPAPHPFFTDERADQVFGHNLGSFPGACHFTLEEDRFHPGRYSASLRASLKNYDGTIEAFFDWITPHVTSGAGNRWYIGHMLYEEDEAPTAFYARPPWVRVDV